MSGCLQGQGQELTNRPAPLPLCIRGLTWQHLALMAPLLPTPRAAMELAEGLYSQLEEELHHLVSQSNSCLEHLELLRKVRELEAEFGKVSWGATS